MKKLLGVLGIFTILLLFSCGNDKSSTKDSPPFTAPTEVEAGADITITYSPAISSTDSSRCWIAVVKKGAPSSSWGEWKYVDDKATKDVLTAPTEAGSYEIRLHDNYPAQSHHLFAKQDITVK